MERNT